MIGKKRERLARFAPEKIRMENAYMPEGELEKRSIEGLTLEKVISEELVIGGRALMCDRGMNLHVDTPFGKGIIPKSEMAYPDDSGEIKDIAVITRVGKPVSFVVTGTAGGTLLLSRRRAQMKCYDEYISELCPGDIIKAEVTHLEPFGAFLDIGCGYPALMSVDAISVSRISHPKDRLSVGDRIYCVVRSIDREQRRVFVSQRELYGTWEENSSRFMPGQTVRGIIRSVEDYGIFVELAPNLAGLAEARPGTSPENLVGRFASVYIKSIIPARMKVKLVLIEVLDRCTAPTPADYFIDCDAVSHMDFWRYSPDGVQKVVMTDFLA